MRNIQQVLERWGGWAASEGGSVYFPPVAAGFKNLLPATQSGRLKCSDNDGLIINSAMSCLKKKDPYLCTLLEWHYVQAMPVRAMGEKLGVSHTHVLKRLQAAEGFRGLAAAWTLRDLLWKASPGLFVTIPVQRDF